MENEHPISDANVSGRDAGASSFVLTGRIFVGRTLTGLHSVLSLSLSSLIYTWISVLSMQHMSIERLHAAYLYHHVNF